MALKGMALELRDARGKVIDTILTSTNTATNYSFTPPNLGTYYISPVVDRNQSASPLQQKVVLVTGGSALANFAIQGVPAVLRVGNAPSGTFVMITTSTYTGAGTTPPPVMRAGSRRHLFSAVSSGVSVTIKVPGGLPGYFVTCWRPQGTGTQVTYSTEGSAAIAGIPAPGGAALNTLCPN